MKKVSLFLFVFLFCVSAHAAISVTIATNEIRVTATDAGGNTIDDIYVAVAASAQPTYMVRSGASAPYTYSLPAQMYLNISGGYIKDYTSGGGTIQWNARSASSTTTFRVQSAAKLELGPDWVVDFSTTITLYTYVYWYGQVVLQGTAGHEVILKHFYNLNVYSYAPNGANTGAWDWDYVICQDMAYSNSSWLYFSSSQQSSRPTHSFKNCTFTDTLGNGRGSIYFYGQGDYTGIELDNLTFDACSSGFTSYGASFKVTNSMFKNLVSYPLSITGAGAGINSYRYTPDTSSNNLYASQQPKITFDTCTFQDNYGANEYEAGLIYGSVVKFKNCTCDELGTPPGTYGFMSYALASLLYEGTQTLTNITNKYYRGGGGHFECKTLTLQVVDGNGDAVEGAVVLLQEPNGYNGVGETLITRADGYVKDLFGDNPVLVYREITNTGGTTFTNWGTYNVVVSKSGLGQNQFTLDMSSDQTVTVQLPAADGTVIYGSTLYGATIY